MRACIILLLCLLFAAPAQADRRQIGTITNVATVSWGPASALEVRASNRVDVAVFDPRTELSVFRLSSDAAAIGGALASASCTMGGAEIPFTQMRGTAPAATTQGSGENVFEPPTASAPASR